VVRLEENYRSTPEVLELANRLVPKLGGAAKTLRATRASGPEPVVRSFAGAEDETDFVVQRVHFLHDAGVPYEEMAVLHRTNARSAAFEEAFTLAEIPFQGAALLERDAARQLRKALARDGYAQAAVAVRETAVAHGLLAHLPPRIGEREVTRQNDLRLLVTIAERLGPDATVDDYLEHLRSHFGGSSGTGVHLLTYHRAKGLEFDAVFLPRLQDRELPSKFARTVGERAEERRLLYVGMTRAREHLTITWSGKVSPFLRELGVDEAPAVAEDDPLLVSLKRWRLERAKEEGKPAYVVFHDTTLAAIAATRPGSEAELRAVPGIGPAKLERYGADVLAAVAAGTEAPAA
jgi:DNA helicase-2/ATP-dependent DNA helicase PcrA